MKTTRQNLIVSIDDRLTGDQEVLSLKTTSTKNIVIQFNIEADKMSVNIDDLQDALDQVKAFIANRPEQPVTLLPIGTNDLSAIKTLETKTEEKIEEIKKEFDLSN